MVITANVEKSVAKGKYATVVKNKMVKKENCCSHLSSNPSHEKELARLNRAIGQMEGIKRMIIDKRYCPDILIQFKAVKSAIKSIESNIIKAHLEHCVAHSFENEEERTKKIDEIKHLLDNFHN